MYSQWSNNKLLLWWIQKLKKFHVYNTPYYITLLLKDEQRVYGKQQLNNRIYQLFTNKHLWERFKKPVENPN